ncbi:MAG: molybdopterin molybdotransferase MoeA [Desulfobulbaceae bacterium]|nr:molybdopterin molybdotransferase MoeA [Desulfobulbaceae bacterium]
MIKPLSLEKARKLIFASAPAGKEESVSLHDALNRKTSQNIRARIAVPHFDQSTMDGYAIRGKDLADSSGPWHFPVSGEIAAGCTELPKLKPKTALRIMTGGAVPPKADRIIPFEWCHESESGITVFKSAKAGIFIRKKGTDLKSKQIIVKKGETITPYHLHLLSTAGVTNLQLYARPEVAFICTGSELVRKSPLPGQIISGNRCLVAALIRQSGALCRDLGMASDHLSIISEKLREADKSDIIITTGGMGPGKYDLMEEVLEKMGVRIFYKELQARPGASTIFGIKHKTLYFSLPGPPPAVHTLFYELVRPAILALQGAHSAPQKNRAILQEDISIRKKGILNLKSAVTRIKGGQLTARPCNSAESANSAILIPASRRHLRKGENVGVHLFHEFPEG